MPKKLAMLTGGGDCPGLNAVIRAVTRRALAEGWEVIGFRNGWAGVLKADTFPIDRQKVAGILHLGGTILGTSRTNPTDEQLLILADNLKKLKVDCLIAIGGDDTLSVASRLHKAGVPVIGVPKTIDNDLEATSMTFGFDSAVACVADALDRLHTTASSHKRIMVIEVMGRHAGWIALYGGLAGGADIILIPEIPFCHERVAAAVKKRDAEGCLSTLIVVAEGAREIDGKEHFRSTATEGEFKLGGIGAVVSNEVANRTGKETRTCVLGHLQRGGAPTTLDRILGTRFGVHAVELIAKGKLGAMVSYRNYEVGSVPIAAAVHRIKLVSPNCQMVQTCRAVGISFGDEQPEEKR